MASKQGTVDFILEQIAAAGAVRAAKMFGEYALFCDGKLVGLVCDDQLFIKPTPGGRAWAPACGEERPYPSARPCIAVGGDLWDDTEWLTGLVKVTARELPAPRPKAKRRLRGA